MKKTLNVGGRILDLSTPKIMGILNTTPDSFYAESRALQDYQERIDQLVNEKVDIIDIGGYSTRPGAVEISAEEEVERVLPAFIYVRSNYPDTFVSVDTFRSEVIEALCEVDSSFIVNDISGGNLDSEMFETVAKLKLPYILMHSRGNPQTMMQEEFVKYDDLIFDITKTLQQKVEVLKSLGVSDVIIDPGVGFAKEVSDNFRIIQNLQLFAVLNLPILMGVSRKSFIWKTLNTKPESTLPASTALHTLCLANGAQIIRVHDVLEAVQVRNILKAGSFI